jgi:hypothetical protein
LPEIVTEPDVEKGNRAGRQADTDKGNNLVTQVEPPHVHRQHLANAEQK